jgi:hypothetical protein
MVTTIKNTFKAGKKQLPQDWAQRYHYRPLLLETFVKKDCFTGASYRAANWTHVGHIQGRGKLSRSKCQSLPIKDFILYPLDRHFRQQLCESPQIHSPKRIY